MQILQEAVKVNGPLCVGLDTDPSYLPENLTKDNKVQAVLDFNLKLIERIACDKSAGCFKVQCAYYEAMGLEGMRVFAETIRAIKKAGFICISDIKRGDIAATSSAYAKAHFEGDFETDIVTLNPYVGFDTLSPFIDYCKTKGKGAFVLLCTSNPGAKDIEQLELKDGRRVLDAVGDEIEHIKSETDSIFKGQTCSPIGAVVGCTQKEDASYLRKKHKNIFFLIPGYGAQGGDAIICRTLLQEAGGTVNSSRGILCAWKKDSICMQKLSEEKSLSLDDIIDASARAALKAKQELTGL